MRILHTSDWHLGARFWSRSILEDQAYVLDQLVHLASELTPDVAIIAGDVFEGSPPSTEAYRLLHETLDRLLELQIQVIALAGPNDDFSSVFLESRWLRERGLHIFTDPTHVLSPLTLKGQRSGLEVRFWPLPYARSSSAHPAQYSRQLVEKVVQRFEASELNVLAAYAWAQGPPRPPELGSLVAPGGLPLDSRLLEFFDYCALGGLHTPLSLSSRSARYSGGVLALPSEGESNRRTASFIDLLEKKVAFIEEYELKPRRRYRKLTGSFDEVWQQTASDRSNDLLALTIMEPELPLDKTLALRRLTPRVVRVHLQASRAAAAAEDHRTRPLTQRFCEYFQSTQGRPLEEAERNLIRQIEEEL